MTFIARVVAKIFTNTPYTSGRGRTIFFKLPQELEAKRKGLALQQLGFEGF